MLHHRGGPSCDVDDMHLRSRGNLGLIRLGSTRCLGTDRGLRGSDRRSALSEQRYAEEASSWQCRHAMAFIQSNDNLSIEEAPSCCTP